MRAFAPVLLCAATPGDSSNDTTTQELLCAQIAAPTLDVVPADVAWGGFVDGDAVLYGDPPQGGPPYAPFKVRIDGLTRLDEGANVSVAATDVADVADGVALGAAAHAALSSPLVRMP